MDFDDFNTAANLTKNFNKMSQLKNQAIIRWAKAEIQLNNGIITNNISEKWSWKKQVLELCKTKQEYMAIQDEYYNGKAEERVATTALKAIENEINILKKLYTETPK